MQDNHEKDLPLFSNAKDIHVKHHILDLTCDMPAKTFRGSITLFLTPLKQDDSSKRYLSHGVNALRSMLLKPAEEDITGTSSVDTTTQEATISPSMCFSYTGLLPCCTKDFACNKLDVSHYENSGHTYTCTSCEPQVDVMNTVLQGKASRVVVQDRTLGDTQGFGNTSTDPYANMCHRPLQTQHRLGQADGTSIQPFQLVLDCCDISIVSVSEIHLTRSQYHHLICNAENTHKNYTEYSELCRQCHRNKATSPLHFSVEKWCVRIWKDGVTSCGDFPRVVKINYGTSPDGLSLKWTYDIFPYKSLNSSISQHLADSSGKNTPCSSCHPLPCVFTPGTWVNNRSFFPCQDVPGAMSTWQAMIHVSEPMVVLMTGEEDGVVTQGQNGQMSYYFQSSMVLPSSTLAIAVGHWECVQISNTVEDTVRSTYVPDFCSHDNGESCTVHFSPSPILPCRLYAPPSLLSQAHAQFKQYIPKCLKAASKLLGPHPFRKLDILIVPPGFASLGMASPNLMFLSQSMLSSDGSMNIRFAHEVSHSWFGLVIGAKDWTEEWLSEGFATYMEDFIHGLAIEWTEDLQRDYAELRALLRYRTLSAEMEITEDELQTLRPAHGSEVKDPSTDVSFVKNGLNFDKGFTQVHYLKGYFLLHYLASLVGTAKFNNMLKLYVMEFHGQLVSSQDFLEYVFTTFPELDNKGLTIESIYREWLDHPGMPKHLTGYQPKEFNTLYSTSLAEVEKWRDLTAKIMRSKIKRKAKKSRKCEEVTLEEEKLETHLIADQIVLILELLLELDKMPAETLEKLREHYCLQSQNADVKHRWCELIVKHNLVAGYSHLQDFLTNHQAMGVYLYGECIISGSKRLERLARTCYDLTKAQMEDGTQRTVQEMLTGKAASSYT